MKARIIFLLAISTLFTIILFFISSYDIIAMQFAWYNRISFLSEFFNDNLYQHQKFGIADLVVFFLLVNLIIYGAGFFKAGESLRKWRREAGYVLNAGFTLAVTSIHSVKWTLSRARPGSIVICFQENGARAGLSLSDINQPQHAAQIQSIMQSCVDTWYSAWYSPGALTAAMGFNKGSFPSGHVATMGVLITVFFLLPRFKIHSLYRWTFLVFVIFLQFMMGYYRMTSDTHWLTDNLASVFLSVIIAYSYYHFLHFPQKTENDAISYSLAESAEKRKAGWEIRMLFSMLISAYSLAAIIVGFRVIFTDHQIQNGIIMIISGAVFAAISAESAFRAVFSRGMLSGKN